MSCCEPVGGFDCATELQRLYGIYMKLIAGRNVVEQQDSSYRRVEFGPGDRLQVLKMYSMLWDQCGLASGLPDLRIAEGASPVRRGPPIGFRGC